MIDIICRMQEDIQLRVCIKKIMHENQSIKEKKKERREKSLNYITQNCADCKGEKVMTSLLNIHRSSITTSFQDSYSLTLF